ncbi:unnamed protein product [Danaus chrysippus]|uniref:(African queen) hypothetical protein n=1 Tax=Danaus chrysippus TaxID=151541 RepID=A0A8J2R8B3_9NEOP|nr:unnamed protein product [Danaus chrysippus]
MADENRVVYPDEVADIKAKEAEESQAVESNSVEDPPLESNVQLKNMIQVPPNCPPGQQMADNTRIVFPDEVEKMRADQEKQAVQSNYIEHRPLDSDIQLDNL